MKKNKNIIFVIMFILASTLLISFNYIMDPYNYGPDKVKHMLKLDIHREPRDMIYTYLNKTKNVKVEHVLIGTSSATSLLNLPSFHCYTAQKMAVLAIPELSLDETYDILKYFLQIHPEVQHVFVSYDVNTYLHCLPYATLPKKPTNFVQDFIKLYYSLGVTKLSINKVLEQFKTHHEDNAQPYYINKKRKYSYNYDVELCMKKNLEKLQKIKELLTSKNIKSTYFMTPLHALYLSNMYKTNQLYKLENLKKEFVNIAPFYDMAYVTKHTAEPFEYFWADVIHPLPFISYRIYDVLVYKKNNPEFAVLVDKNNIEKILNEQRKLIENYINENAEQVDEYVNSDYSPVEVEKFGEYKNKPHLPEGYENKVFCSVGYMGRF